MAVAFGNVQGTTATGTGTIIVTKPTGLSEGDLMIAVIAGSTEGSSGSAPNNANFTSLFTDRQEFNIAGSGATSHELRVLTKVASSSDEGSADFTFTTGASMENLIATLFYVTGSSFSGPGNVTDYDFDYVTDDGTPTYSGGVTTNGDNAFLVMGQINKFNSVTGYSIANNDPTWTERFNDGSANQDSDMIMGVATATYANTGSTGDYTMTLTSSDNDEDSIGFLLTIQETENGSVTGSTGTILLTGNTGDPAGSATVTGSTGTLTIEGNTGTAEVVEKDWTAQNKSSSSWTPKPKS